MESHYGTPSSSHRGEWASNGSDGATRSDSSSPLGTFASYTQPTYTTTPTLPKFQQAPSVYSSGFLTGEKGNQQQLVEPLAAADWDPRLMVPRPLDTLINRLNAGRQISTLQPKMKVINEMTKSFKPRYAARASDDWTQHLDMLETDVFQKEDFKPKQIYFSIKVTIFGEPERCLRRLETGTERPNLKAFIPTWYKPKEEDWKALYLQWPFSQLSFSLRCAIIIIYFFHKYERGSSQKALRRFEKALQGDNESIEDWGTRLSDYAMRAKRYGIKLPFHIYLRQWMCGTRPGYFLTELRKAKNPSEPGKTPIVHDRDSFDLWYHNQLANYRQTQREQEGHQQLKLQERYSNRNSFNRQNSQPSKKTSDNYRNARQPHNPNNRDLRRQGPGYK